MNVEISPYIIAGLRRVDMPDTLKTTTSQAIIEATCEYFMVGIEEIKSRCRKRYIVYPRQIAIYLIAMHTPLTLMQILAEFGHAIDDHTTVIHSRDIIKKRLSVNDGSLKQDLKEIYEAATTNQVIGKSEIISQ